MSEAPYVLTVYEDFRKIGPYLGQLSEIESTDRSAISEFGKRVYFGDILDWLEERYPTVRTFYAYSVKDVQEMILEFDSLTEATYFKMVFSDEIQPPIPPKQPPRQPPPPPPVGLPVPPHLIRGTSFIPDVTRWLKENGLIDNLLRVNESGASILFHKADGVEMFTERWIDE